MLMTRQEIITEAISIQLAHGGPSCESLYSFRIPKANAETVFKMREEYAKYSNASRYGGFIHLRNICGWYKMSAEEKQSYRLEMLYYFWLSNQEM